MPITVIPPGQISPPNNKTEITPDSPAVPVDKTEIPSGSPSSPTDKAELAPGDVAAPVDKTEIPPGSVDIPGDLLEIPAGVVAIPVDKTEIAAASPAIPNAKTEIAPGDISSPVSKAELTPGSVAAPNEKESIGLGGQVTQNGNFIGNSRIFDSTHDAWSSGNGDLDFQTSPSVPGIIGTTETLRLEEGNAISIQDGFQEVGPGFFIHSGRMTFSVYVRAGSVTTGGIRLRAQDNTEATLIVDLNNGNILLSEGLNAEFNIEDATEGWYRLSIIKTQIGTFSVAPKVTLLASQGSTVSYQGGGNANFLYFSAANLTPFDVITDYIQTESREFFEFNNDTRFGIGGENYLPFSQDIVGNWSSTGLFAGDTLNNSSADGFFGVQVIRGAPGNNEHNVRYQSVAGLQDNQVVTFSCYIQPSSTAWVSLGVEDKLGSVHRAWFRLSDGFTGTVQAGVISTRVESFSIANRFGSPQSWYRIGVVANVSVGGAFAGVHISLADTDNNLVFDATSDQDITIFNPQLNLGPTMKGALITESLVPLTTVAASQTDAYPPPNDKGELAPVAISIPNDKTEISPTPISSPNDKTEISAGIISAPVDKTEVSPGSMVAPTDKAEITPAVPGIPTGKTEISPTSPSAPVNKSEISPGSIASPTDKTEISPGSPSIPVSKTELAPGSVSVPASKAEISPATPGVPTGKTEVSPGQLAPPSSKTTLTETELPYKRTVASFQFENMVYQASNGESDFDNIFRYTRASSATYLDRFVDYNGSEKFFLNEDFVGTVENIASSPDDFSANRSQLSQVIDYDLIPGIGNVGRLLVPDAGATLGSAYQQQSLDKTAAVETRVNVSIFAKAGGYDTLNLLIYSDSTSNFYQVRFSLKTGDVIDSSAGGTFSSVDNYIRYQYIGNGWFRLSATLTTDDDALLFARIRPDDLFSSEGDGKKGIYVYGIQGTESEKIRPFTVYDQDFVESPRFQYSAETGKLRGVLIEQGANNEMLYSEDLTNAVWTQSAGASIEALQTQAPDLAFSADRLALPATNINHFLQQTVNVSVGSTIVWSIYCRTGGLEFVQLSPDATRFNDASSYQNFDVKNCTLGSGSLASGVYAGISDAGQGWCRVWMSATADSTGDADFKFSVVNSASSVRDEAFTPDTSLKMYFWGAQMTTQGFVSSYSHTEGAVAIRSPDSLTSQTGLLFPESGSITVIFKWDLDELHDFIGFIRLLTTGSSGNNRFTMRMDNSGLRVANGDSTDTIFGALDDLGIDGRIIYTYDTETKREATYFGSTLLGENSNGNFDEIRLLSSTVGIGSGVGPPTQNLFGNVSEVTVIEKALSQEEIELL